MKMPEAYVQLQRDIHDALRVQHPEWIQPDGDCPIGDWYDERFAELLWGDAGTRLAILDRGTGKTSWRIEEPPGLDRSRASRDSLILT
jgi:hypothetical protein